MISHKKFSSCAGGAQAVADYMLAGEYYLSETDQAEGRAFYAGKAAAGLGLSDDMTRAEKRSAFERMLMGYHPTENNPDGSKKALVQNAGLEGLGVMQKDEKGNLLRTKNDEPKVKWTGGRVMCHDFTFTPSKAFALLCAKADDATRRRLEELLVEANEIAMDYVEAQAVVCNGGSSEKGTIKTRKAKTSRFTVVHQQSRDGDPDWHVHNAVLNIAQDADGNYAALETGGMMRVAKAADKIAQAHLAHRIEQVLGIQTEQRAIRDAQGKPKPGEMTWGVVGIDDAEMKTFSKRRTKITEYQEALTAMGIAISTDQAAQATRSAKQEDPLPVALKRWKHEAQSHGYTTTLDELRERSKTQERTPRAPSDWRQWDMTQWVADFCATNKDPKRWSVDCIELAVAQTLGTTTLAQVRRTAAEIAAEHFTRLDGSTDETTKWDRQQDLLMPTRWLEAEEHILAWAAESKKYRDETIGVAQVEEACKAYEKRKGFDLTDEQRAALLHVVADSGRWAMESGLAGTGKTTVAEIAVDLWRAEGYRVIGVSTSQDATQKLQQDAKMDEAYNGAALLARLDNDDGKLAGKPLDSKTVLLVDEAGMMDIWQAERLLKYAHDAGCKVVMQGDTRQLQSVGGGAPFAQLRRDVGGVELKENRRQQRADLEPTRALHGTDKDGNIKADVPDQEYGAAAIRSMAIWDILAKQDRVRITGERAEAVAKLAHDYAACAVPIQDRLALASTHEDRLATNWMIRQELRAQGALTAPDTQVANADGATDLAVGDRIRMTKRLDLSRKNADTPEGTWAAVDAHGKRLGRADLNNGLQGTIESVVPEGAAHRITMRVADDHPKLAGAQVSWRSDVGESWTHDYCVTVHAAQGQTKLAVFHLGDPSSSNETNLVAYTRGKTDDEWAKQGVKTYTLYADVDTADVLRERALGTNRQSIAALDLRAERQAENEADAIRREAQERGEEPTVELIEHGVAPYRFDDDKSPSYYATVRDAAGRERTLWGVGLESALGESGAQKGDQITLAVSGSTDVEVNGIPAHRNHWVVTQPARELEREQRADAVLANGLEQASKSSWSGDERDTILTSRLAVAFAEREEPVHASEAATRKAEQDVAMAREDRKPAAIQELERVVNARIERAGGDPQVARAWAATAYEKRITPVKAQEQALEAEWQNQQRTRGLTM